MDKIITAYKTEIESALPAVARYQRKLSSLNDWWGKITLIGKINSYSIATTILTEMQITRKQFTVLQQELIDNLICENVKKQALDDTERSQVAVDLLIRNLFERTADVGFLSTDDDIRDFLLDVNETKKAEIKRRLDEYVKKYSVYDEIVILDASGEVMVHLDDNNPIAFSKDKLIKESLETKADYLETFRFSDLQPNKSTSLIYSCKITLNNKPNSPVLGVLCLCFRFEDEVSSIFQRLLPESNKSILMLLDADNRVIANSEPKTSDLGIAQLDSNDNRLATIAGEKYVTTMAQTKGYQGFYGLGWSGYIASPFVISREQNNVKPKLGNNILDMNESSLFSEELREVRRQSLRVKEDLRLVVINGKITAARNESSEFIPVLEEIREIGEKTGKVFEESIIDLQQTVLSARMNQVAFQSSLTINIMDRNLYERANDCRWWALTSSFRTILTKPQMVNDDQEKITNTLAYINELYTVYTNIYVYNVNREIIAVSNPQYSSLIGQQASEQSGAPNALLLRDTQAYCVSPFVASDYYGGEHTYIYNSAIFSPGESSKAVGGVGVVFDSTPEFKAMLNDVLPKDEHGEPLSNCFALFAERAGTVVSVTENNINLTTGSKLDFDALAVDELETSKIITYRGVRYIVGSAVSQGYREYKTTGDYQNDIVAYIFMAV